MDGKKLKELREAAGMTQEDLAKKIEVDQSMVSMLEKGRRRASADLLFDIADALGVKADDLR